ncbi:MAG TPA: pyridoxal phosphate-dependent aminotransferase [Longimicrobiaceae bacterium]|nr:pyridoxal phosphate-dependent aminotransferase [Longimicrobiaceae bacterium]
MPSAATHVSEVVPALSIRFNSIVYELKARGTDVIVLSLGEAFFDIPLFDFAEMPIPESYHYNQSRGNPDLRRLLAGYYGRQYGVAVDADTEILVTAGSKAAIYMSLMAILNPGDEVLVLEPAWVSYSEQVRLCHGVPVMVPYHQPVFGLEGFITPRTRAVIVNNPNNPSGRVMSRVELEHLHALADRYDLFLISDEAYSDFLLDDRFISCGVLDPQKRHTIVVNSMSKNYGMSGWRIGYVIGNSGLIDEVLKINQHLITCPPTILEYYLVRHFHDVLEITKPQIADVVRRRCQMADFMEELGISCLPGDATFYLFASIEPSTLDSMEFCTRLLRDHHVCAVPGIGYGTSCDRYIRISVGAEDAERVREGIRRIRGLIDATSPVPSEVVDLVPL